MSTVPPTICSPSGHEHELDTNEMNAMISQTRDNASSISEYRDDYGIGESSRSGQIHHENEVLRNWSNAPKEEQPVQDPRPVSAEFVTRFKNTDGNSVASSQKTQTTGSLQRSTTAEGQLGASVPNLNPLAISKNDDDACSTTSSQKFPSPGAYDTRFYPPFPRMSDWQFWMRNHPNSDSIVPTIEEYEEWLAADPNLRSRDTGEGEDGEYTYNYFRAWREAVNFRRGASTRMISTHINQSEIIADSQRVGHRRFSGTSSRNEHDGVVQPLSPALEYGASQPSKNINSRRDTYSSGVGLSAPQGQSSYIGYPSAATEFAYHEQTNWPLPPRPRMRSPPRDIIIPRWQPDAEVTLCPICRTQFSFFVRKHHCRKCGRVVCSACSPHRITIPHQYIVQPPEPPMGHATTSMRSNGDHARAGSFAVSGGESVRICNPCVPDPNTTPPPQDVQTQLSPTHSRSISNGTPVSFTISRTLSGESAPTADMLRHSTRHQARSSFGLSRSRSSTVGNNATNPTSPRLTSSMVSSLSPQLPPSNPLSPRDELSNSSGHALHPRRRRIPEGDICPICHTIIPGRTLANADATKEAHIANCIDDEIRRFSNRSESSTPVPAQSAAAASSTTALAASRPLPRTPETNSTSAASPSTFAPASAPTPAPLSNQSSRASATVTTSTPSSRTLAREQAHAAVVLSASQPQQSSRRIDSILYTSTEKDCVDDAECTICLEEFEVGERMRRLDCFCRFHMVCIDGWLERNRSCPVHQHGAGF